MLFGCHGNLHSPVSKRTLLSTRATSSLGVIGTIYNMLFMTLCIHTQTRWIHTHTHTRMANLLSIGTITSSKVETYLSMSPNTYVTIWTHITCTYTSQKVGTGGHLLEHTHTHSARTSHKLCSPYLWKLCVKTSSCHQFCHTSLSRILLDEITMM